MKSTQRYVAGLASISAFCLVAGTAIAAPAVAKGGGNGGGGPSTPPSTAPTDPCAPLAGKVYSDGSVANDFTMYGVSGGCAVIQYASDFSATVYEVLPQPGWSYRLDVKLQSNGTRVSIDYTEAATGRKTSMQVEPGKTIVKG